MKRSTEIQGLDDEEVYQEIQEIEVEEIYQDMQGLQVEEVYQEESPEASEQQRSVPSEENLFNKLKTLFNKVIASDKSSSACYRRRNMPNAL